MISGTGLREWRAMLTGAASEIRSAHAWLSELDSICGDGDHGTTMLRAANLLERCVAQSSSKSLQELLSDVAWALMGLDGGATGPLLGSFFLGLAETVGPKTELDVQALAESFEAGLAAVCRQSRARVGDKSMLDALVPATEAMRRAADEGKPVQNSLWAATVAAQEGAARTKDFVARTGRAKYLGERTLGTQDPGATSLSLIFKGFHAGIAALEK
jgi:phosphoenolpyruvate---glycerone phosphotransferase subunit DhaL